MASKRKQEVEAFKIKTNYLLEKMGLQNLELKDAGEGLVFKNTQTRYKLVFNENGELKALGIKWNDSFDEYHLESTKFYLLQSRAVRLFGGIPCDKTSIASTFGRTVKTRCTICGGYGVKPIFNYGDIEESHKAKVSKNY